MSELDKLKAQLQRQRDLLSDAKEEDEIAFVKKKIQTLENQIEVLANAKEKADKKIVSHQKLREPSCQELIQNLKGVLNRFESGQKERKTLAPTKKKRVSTILAEGIANVISRAVTKETTRDKVSKIDVEALSEAEKHFIDGLKSLRNALGGISSENDAFIKTFKNDIDNVISIVKEKQEALKQKS